MEESNDYVLDINMKDKGTIFAELFHVDGTTAIIATLEYILLVIKDRGFNIKEVIVH